MEVGAFGYGGGHCNRLQSKATLNGTTEAVALPVTVHTLTEAGALEHPPRLISKKTKKKSPSPFLSQPASSFPAH
jgi:hypothetical protein